MILIQKNIRLYFQVIADITFLPALFFSVLSL